MSKINLDRNAVVRLAGLSKVLLKPNEIDKFAKQLDETVRAIGVIQEIKTAGIKETSHPTDLINITRVDKVDSSLIIPPKNALENAKQKYKDWFCVKAVLDEK